MLIYIIQIILLAIWTSITSRASSEFNLELSGPLSYVCTKQNILHIEIGIFSCVRVSCTLSLIWLNDLRNMI